MLVPVGYITCRGLGGEWVWCGCGGVGVGKRFLKSLAGIWKGGGTGWMGAVSYHYGMSGTCWGEGREGV